MIHKLLCSHSQGLLLLIYRHTNVCVFAHVCRRLDGGGCTAGRQRLTPLCCVRHSDWAARRARETTHAERRSAGRRFFYPRDKSKM